MTSIKDFFAKYKLKEENLLPFGFIKNNDFYQYSFTFFQGQFKAEITISKDGIIKDKVIELAFNEEFDAIHIDTFVSSFASTVKDAYYQELSKIRDACFQATLFNSKQAHKVIFYLKKKYDDEPSFPFKEKDNYAVFRSPKNDKWYALLMTLKRQQVFHKGEGNIEVINVKVNQEKRETYLQHPGIIAAYHMNKQQWVSIILDEEVEDKLVYQLLDESRIEVEKKRR